MPPWESILEQYLEGAGSRAAAESLRFRIALPPEAHREVEMVLRLADRLTNATQSVRPPAGAVRRLGERLLHTVPPQVRPNWVHEDGDFAAPDGVARPGADEDAVNAVIEGAVIEGAAIKGTSMSGFMRAGRSGGELQPDLDAFRKIAAASRRGASSAPGNVLPPGALDRLRAKLAEARDRGEGGANPVVAGRLLAQLRGEAISPPETIRLPDVLAAGKEPLESNEPSDGRSDKPI